MAVFISAVCLMMAISGAGQSVNNGLHELSDAIRESSGLVEKCDGPWYNRDCKWEREA